MNEYTESIKNNFFQPFYVQRIEKARSFGKNNFDKFDLPLMLFWFSVIDFYGGLYLIGKGKSKSKDVANKKGFIFFIKSFFPSPVNECGEFIYNVFRNGSTHQISPKKAGINVNSDEKNLIWIEIDNRITDPDQNKIAYINLYQLTELTYMGFRKLMEIIECSNEIDTCKNIFDALLLKPDGLKDGKILNSEYNKISDKIFFVEK